MAGRVTDEQLAAVGVSQPPSNIQPEPKATPAASGGLVQPRIPPEDPVTIGHRYPRPLILNGYHRLQSLPGR